MKTKRRATFDRILIPMAERFWSKVDKRKRNECWPWTGAKQPFGYGYLAGTRRLPMTLAHRYSYEIHIGPIPKGVCVLHRCDNPPCVNPAHLFLGSRKDNAKDCKAKGRVYDRHGENNPRARLTRKDIRAMKKLRKNGMTQQAIADRFDVCQVHVSAILRGKLWK